MNCADMRRRQAEMVSHARCAPLVRARHGSCDRRTVQAVWQGFHKILGGSNMANVGDKLIVEKDKDKDGDNDGKD